MACHRQHRKREGARRSLVAGQHLNCCSIAAKRLASQRRARCKQRIRHSGQALSLQRTSASEKCCPHVPCSPDRVTCDAMHCAQSRTLMFPRSVRRGGTKTRGLHARRPAMASCARCKHRYLDRSLAASHHPRLHLATQPSSHRPAPRHSSPRPHHTLEMKFSTVLVCAALLVAAPLTQASVIEVPFRMPPSLFLPDRSNLVCTARADVSITIWVYSRESCTSETTLRGLHLPVMT